VHPDDWSFFAEAKDPDDFHGRTSMALLEQLGMLDLDPGDRDIVPGVRVVHSPGHTPGHRSVILTDGPFTMLFTGDLLHVPVQAAHPEWLSSHDEEPPVGVASRVALLAQARDERWGVAVSHFGRPFGGVLREGDAQRWVSA
jgi:glyoxylase-like metal-dependent hydrolase (beta-lactamase superfamily II)